MEDKYFMEYMSRKTGVGGRDRELKIAESWQMLYLGNERAN